MTQVCALFLAEVEISRTSLASRTHFEILGLEIQVLGLEGSSPQKLHCPRLEDSTFLELLKCCKAPEKFFGKRFFSGDCWKFFIRTFFLESTCACVLLCPWPWEGLSLIGAVLGLGLGFFVSLTLASSLVSSTPPLILRYLCITGTPKKGTWLNAPLNTFLNRLKLL